MAPTSRTDRRRWNPKGDIKDQFDDNTANAKELVGDINLEGKLCRRALLQLLGWDGDKDEDESEDESEDEHEHGDDRSNVGLPITNPILHPSLPSFPPPPPLPPLPSNPLSGLFPPPKSSPPPNSNPPAAAPPPQQPPPPSSSTPPQVSPTGVTGNFGSASPSGNPRRTTLSAALPKSTSGGDDSDDDDDDDDDGRTTSGAPSPTRSTFSKSTRSVLSLTAAISPYETYTTEDGQKSSISSTESKTRSPTTSTTAPAQTPETATRVETAMTGIPSPNGTAAIGQGQEAAHTSRLSPGAEKAVIASVTIGGFFLLLVLAFFFWRRASKRKSAGRKSTWPTNSPSREIFAGPRRVSTKLGEKFTSMKAHEIFEGPRRVSSKVGENFTTMKAHIRSGSFGWCSINDDDDDTPTNEKSAAPVATNAGGLLERRLGAMTPPQRVTVNSYGMIFRKPKRDSRLSDIFQPRGQQRTWPPSIPPSPEVPPSPEGIRIPIVRPNTQMAAAAHLENARKSVNAGVRNMPRTPRTPLRQNMRMSDVSSLSSGFGDGDIVIIQPPNAAAAAKTAYTDSHVNVIAVRSSPERKHFSSRFSNRLSRGDTVGTNSSSEDGRPRFRSISSWVGQQSRRVRRAAASRNEDGVPDVPDVPPEQGFDMMMPDGQEPRRVESSMWKKTQGGAV
ncbi:hypothetical protein N5P37_011295 [Trichoderma harzianum]|nr:hypothetical protein N5P37_011295 [Trichoderma harzianum]